MKTFEVIGLFFAAATIVLAGVQWIVSNALKKGANNQKLQDTHDKIKDYDKKSVECEKRFTQLEERKTDNKSIEDIRMSIVRMAEKLDMALSGSGAGELVQAHSPISLTQIGRDIAAEMGIEARIVNNWDKIHQLLDNSLESKNPYDIQQFCIGVASTYPERFFSNEDMEFMKTYAYGKGKPLSYYGGMIGVMVRDAYFLHKDIDVTEIDKHDPQKKTE